MNKLVEEIERLRKEVAELKALLSKEAIKHEPVPSKNFQQGPNENYGQ